MSIFPRVRTRRSSDVPLRVPTKGGCRRDPRSRQQVKAVLRELRFEHAEAPFA